jgi:hypothetical protein
MTAAIAVVLWWMRGDADPQQRKRPFLPVVEKQADGAPAS